MDDAGGPFAARAAAVAGTSSFEAYDRAEVAAVLADAADRQAELQAAIDEARQAALQPPEPLDVVPRADADQALQAAEAKLAALQAELVDARAQLQQAQLAQAHLVPLEVPAAVEAPGLLPWGTPPAVAPAAVAPAAVVPPVVPVPVPDAATVAVPAVEPAPVPVAPVPVRQVIVSREPYARATGLLQVVIWSTVVAVVLIVLLAWFA